ncbi:hypothetical protein ACFQS7_03395 [Dankookia sp. GCM10030260]|uniref:hypothetical protein n=1 Tax=Dankookia sp. GCM10030260 TaxID=3273390 RepID=UPI0036118EC8
MVKRYALVALLLLPAAAQAQQRVVVPEGVAVAVPARGAPAAPRAAMPPRLRTARPLSPAVELGAPPEAIALVPLAAAAALAVALSGGGGGGGGVSAPVRTR